MYPATLTDLGERAHLGGVDTGLDTHITDVVNVILHEDLRDVVLVGHSYAGTVLPGLADRMPDRIATQGLTGEQCRLIQPRPSDHPFATVTEPLALTGSDTSEQRRIVITCNDFRGLAEAGIGRYQQAAALEMHHLAAGHWPMFGAPQELADLLDSAAKA
ncbi:alpha/beta fold hydrolase [Streptomyces griseofuscus]|uniref:alpha/beta fold hydrolase n=1 Tax=Streptomyces griseofuscus TaxID=146922 RepID=UPI00367600CE